MTRLELPLEGMTCASCANRIERRLNRLDGVQATVNYATERAAVAFDPERVSPDDLVGAVAAAGYRARLAAPAPQADGETEQLRALRRRLVAAVVLGLPVLVLSMVPPLQVDRWPWVAFALATPVVLWAGWPFHRAAWQALRHGSATMDTLVSVGTLAAWGWSTLALVLLGAGAPGMRMPFAVVLDRSLSPAHVYFEVAVVVVAALLAGRLFEARARRRAGAALRALLALGAKDVAVLAADGAERRVPVEALRAGDRFVVRPGERVATDGVVEQGASAVDESLLTGEA